MKSSFSMDESGFSAASVVVVTDVDPRAVETVETLLNAGADVNATNATGRSALHHAATIRQPALANELLAHGARRDLRDASGKTPLDLARESVDAEDAPLVLLRSDAVIKLLEG
jgi:ankyrin repeat protein